MTKPISPAKAYEAFEDALTKAHANYAQYWRDFFQAYGFTILKGTYISVFDMEFNGAVVQAYCYPRGFQGIKLTMPRAKNAGNVSYPDERKVMSESGAIKLMKEYGLGKPPV